jgi:hypothetical protein
MRQFIIGPYTPPISGLNFYGIQRRHAKEYAERTGRELAEGPTVLVTENDYGPVELWPLVYKEALN